MDPIHITTREAMLYGALINAGIGLVLGLIPLLFGYFNKRLKLGLAGFLMAIVGGAALGIFLSIPATVIFTWLVVRNPKSNPAEVQAAGDEPIDASVERSEEDPLIK